MNSVRDTKAFEIWDRLVLLLIAKPSEGWEPEFKDITRREIERLRLLGPEREQEDE